MLRVAIDYNPRLSKQELRLVALPNRIRNLRPLMQQGIAPAANRMLARHWETKGAAFGHRWAPWAPSTRAYRIAKGNAAKGLLRDTDNLFRALFRARSTDDRLQPTADGGLRLQLNTRVPYAIYHQVGTRFMPERQVIPMPLPRSFTREVRDIVRAYLYLGKFGGGG